MIDKDQQGKLNIPSKAGVNSLLSSSPKKHLSHNCFSSFLQRYKKNEQRSVGNHHIQPPFSYNTEIRGWMGVAWSMIYSKEELVISNRDRNACMDYLEGQCHRERQTWEMERKALKCIIWTEHFILLCNIIIEVLTKV